jgi:hypothetical protein
VRDEAAAADKEAAEEAAVKRAAEEAAAKKAAEEATEKAATVKAAGAVGGLPAPARRRQRPWPRGLRLQVAPPRRPNVPTGVFGNLGLSSSLSPFLLHSYYPFCPGPLPPAWPP